MHVIELHFNMTYLFMLLDKISHITLLTMKCILTKFKCLNMYFSLYGRSKWPLSIVFLERGFNIWRRESTPKLEWALFWYHIMRNTIYLMLWTECLCPSKWVCWGPPLPRSGIWRWALCRQLGSEEVMKARSSWWDECPYEKRPVSWLSLLSLSFWIQQEGSYLLVRRELSPEPDNAGTRISDFPTPRTSRNKDWLCQPPHLWHFVVAARVD